MLKLHFFAVWLAEVIWFWGPGKASEAALLSEVGPGENPARDPIPGGLLLGCSAVAPQGHYLKYFPSSMAEGSRESPAASHGQDLSPSLIS